MIINHLLYLVGLWSLRRKQFHAVNFKIKIFSCCLNKSRNICFSCICHRNIILFSLIFCPIIRMLYLNKKNIILMKMKRVFILWLKFIYFPVAVIAVNDYATKGPNFPSIIQEYQYYSLLG